MQLPGGALGVGLDALGLLDDLLAVPFGLLTGALEGLLGLAAQRRRPLDGLGTDLLAVRRGLLAELVRVLPGLGEQLLGCLGRLLDLLDGLLAGLRADLLALGDRLGAQLLGLAAQPAGLLLKLDRLGAVLLGVVLRRTLELLGDVVRLGAQPVRLGLGLGADPLRLLGCRLGGVLGVLLRLVEDVLGRLGRLRQLGRALLGGDRAGLLGGLFDDLLGLGTRVGDDLFGVRLGALGFLGGLADQAGDLLLRRTRALLVGRLGAGERLLRGRLGLGDQLLGLGLRLAQRLLGLRHALLGGPAELGGLPTGGVRLGRGGAAQLLGVVGGLLGLRGRGVQQPLGVRTGPEQDLLGLRTGLLGRAGEALPGLAGEPLRLGACGGHGLVGLGARLVEEPAGLLLGPGAQLLRPRHVLVDVRLDGLPALGQLLVQLLAAGHRLLMQLGLQPGRVLRVLLEDALGLRPGLAQLPLRLLAQLVGLDLGVPQQLLGLIADVTAVEGRPGHDGAPRLVQLGAQHLDLVAEVLGVLDRLFPLGLQPIHLGLEPREVVDVSRRLSLLAFVAPHCAVPSVPWSQVSPYEHRPSAERGPRGMVSDQRRSTGCCPTLVPRNPDPGNGPTVDGRGRVTLD